MIKLTALIIESATAPLQETDTYKAYNEKYLFSTSFVTLSVAGSIMVRLRPEEYTVGWICALDVELTVAESMLDDTHEPLLSRTMNLQNQYVLGRMASHNVVLNCLPSGDTGSISAANLANQMLSSFTSIKTSGFGLMVGIGAGAPSTEHDIRLGDVVVSNPGERSGGVIQYDFGKIETNGKFVITGHLDRPPTVLLNALSLLKSRHRRKGHEILRHLSAMLAANPEMRPEFSRHSTLVDLLYQAEYEHQDAHSPCVDCDVSQLVDRQPRPRTEPIVHYGLIASANQVMRHGKTRERLRKEENVKCFEMEAAGLMNTFPCLVVRGICDYADSHKNKSWQPYAAAVAAAYAKELLCIVESCRLMGCPQYSNL